MDGFPFLIKKIIPRLIQIFFKIYKSNNLEHKFIFLFKMKNKDSNDLPRELSIF